MSRRWGLLGIYPDFGKVPVPTYEMVFGCVGDRRRPTNSDRKSIRK